MFEVLFLFYFCSEAPALVYQCDVTDFNIYFVFVYFDFRIFETSDVQAQAL